MTYRQTSWTKSSSASTGNESVDSVVKVTKTVGVSDTGTGVEIGGNIGDAEKDNESEDSAAADDDDDDEYDDDETETESPDDSDDFDDDDDEDWQ